MTSEAEKRGKLLQEAFQMPSFQTMVSRKSSITNAFVNSVIPVVVPTVAEIKKALAILRMNANDIRCAYCGDRSTEWDHLRPLVVKRRPTGYISEIANLVPACGKCNQSKGNKDWRVWMLSNAKRSPTGRGIADVALRVARLNKYEGWRRPIRIDFETILGSDDWSHYWSLWEKLNSALDEAQIVADRLRVRVNAKLTKKRTA
jgi:HNH endonuclease